MELRETTEPQYRGFREYARQSIGYLANELVYGVAIFKRPDPLCNAKLIWGFYPGNPKSIVLEQITEGRCTFTLAIIIFFVRVEFL